MKPYFVKRYGGFDVFFLWRKYGKIVSDLLYKRLLSQIDEGGSDLEENKNNNNGSVGGYVSKYSTDYSVSSQGAGIPVYEKYKGKEAHASKEYEITGGEKVALFIVMGLVAVIFCGGVVAYFMPIPTGTKILIIVLAGLAILLGAGGFVLIVTLRHHKKDPMEMHYYDVDIEHNYITGESRDDIREISKEEFYSQKKNRE